MDIGKSAKTGIAWTGLSQVLKQGLDFGTGIVMARLLAPRDFGVIGATMIFLSLMSIFTSFGFSTAVVQRKEVDESYLGTAQTLAFCTGLTSALCMIGGARYIGMFFKNPTVAEVVPLMSLMFIITSFNIIPTALISRKMEFHKTTAISVVGSCIYSAVALSMAFFGYGVWSLVFGPLVGSITGAVLLSRAASYWPRFRFHKPHMKELVNFGGFMTLSSLLNHLGRNADNLIVGRYLGAESLGFYSRAYNLGTLPKEIIVSVFGTVLFPAFSRMQNEQGRLKSAYLKSVNAIMVLGSPICLLLAVTAPDFVPVVYGEKWLTSAAPLRWLAVGGGFYCLLVPCTSLLLAMGKTRMYTALQLLYSITISTTVFALRENGIYPISVAVSVVIGICWVAYLYSAHKVAEVKVVEYWRSIRISFIANLLLLATLIGTRSLLGNGTSVGSLLTLCVATAAGAAVYMTGLLVGKDPVAIEVADIISAKLVRLKQTAFS